MDDWLEQRLAEDPYLPDGGFTARVSARLPQRPARNLMRLRFLVLAPLFLLSLGIGLLEIRGLADQDFNAPAWLKTAAPILSPAHALHGWAGWIQQPFFLPVCMALSLGLSVGLLPLLRRWT